MSGGGGGLSREGKAHQMRNTLVNVFSDARLGVGRGGEHDKSRSLETPKVAGAPLKS